jgi:hypothetical protein
MSIVIPVESTWGRELARWNTPRNRYVEDANGETLRDEAGQPIKGMNAVGIEPYPKMLYKAQKNAQGKVLCLEAPPRAEFYPDERTFATACAQVDQFNKRCICTVASEEEHRARKREGWSDTAAEALAIQERLEQDIANAAAEANYAAKRLSPHAQAELEAAGRETHQHVTDVVGVPKSARGRSTKKHRRVVAEQES